MNREELDRMWNKALGDAIRDGEEFTRYHFAALVAAAEREACAQICNDHLSYPAELVIRARGNDE
jgi:hypothetical protein